MSTTQPLLSLENVSKNFGAITAIDGLSLDIRQGEFFALLGPSGCGKTTLLRMIAGFETCDQGRILLEGNDIKDLRASRRPINLMFQSYALFPHMTVYRNIAYGLEMEKRPANEIKSRVDEVMDMAELTAVADRKPEALSGGQQQRVALARALVKRPRMLLLDEPLAALDRKLRGQMQLELKRLQHKVGITFVLVTHDQEEALVMADRIALMRDGHIEQIDPPRRLYEHPLTRFVAGFIGQTNLFEVRATTGGLALNGNNILRCNDAENLAPDCAVAVAVRPERMILSRQDVLNGHNTLSGTIKEIVYHGQNINIHVEIQDIERPVIVRLSAGDQMADEFSTGETVYCNWKPEHGRLLTS